MKNYKKTCVYRIFSAFIVCTFILNLIVPSIQAQQYILNLPVPGTMIPVSNEFTPTIVKALTIHPDNPLHFSFIMDTGDEQLDDKAFKKESKKMAKYFLATLTIPEDDLWVNLSPYEHNRIIPQGLDETELGRDLLTQDYILKQLTSSLMYPENDLGKKFWNRVYAKAQEKFGTTEIPLNTFNKIWIVPEKAVLYEHDQTVFILENHLKVMLEEDYVAMGNNHLETGTASVHQKDFQSQIIREILIPEIEKEVNEGKNFANLRQIYNSMLLATWYKRNLRESLLGQVYVDKKKTKGVDVADKEIKQKIYNQYIQAFKKGVYNYIREDIDPATQQIIPRKYFSGGTKGYTASSFITIQTSSPVTKDIVSKGEYRSTEVIAVENLQIGSSSIQGVKDKKGLKVDNRWKSFLKNITNKEKKFLTGLGIDSIEQLTALTEEQFDNSKFFWRGKIARREFEDLKQKILQWFVDINLIFS